MIVDNEAVKNGGKQFLIAVAKAGLTFLSVFLGALFGGGGF